MNMEPQRVEQLATRNLRFFYPHGKKGFVRLNQYFEFKAKGTIVTVKENENLLRNRLLAP